MWQAPVLIVHDCKFLILSSSLVVLNTSNSLNNYSAHILITHVHNKILCRVALCVYATGITELGPGKYYCKYVHK